VTDESNNGSEDLLKQATALLRDSAGAEGPPQHVVDATLMRLEAEQESRHSMSQWRFTMFKNRSWAAAAAIVIVSGIALFWVTQRSATVAFGAVVEKVRGISAVSFKMKGTMQLPNETKRQDLNAHIIVGEPYRMRETLDSAKMTIVMDMAAGKQMMLDSGRKTAMVIDMGKTMNPQLQNANVLDHFRKFDPKTFKPVGEKVIGSKKLQGFKSETADQTQTVWVDPETKLPVEMEQKISGGFMIDTDVVMSDLDWSPQIDDSTFSLTAPEGYHNQTVSMDMTNLGEKDLIDSLRQMTDFNDGTLPDSLDMAGMLKGVKNQATRLAQEKNQDADALRKKAMEQMTPIARGLGFIVAQTDAHYAGKGVKLNEANRPILWYKPKDSQKYHVIDAELKVTEVDADQLPKVESVPVSAGSMMKMPATAPVQPK